MWWLVDSSSNYVFNFEIYCGANHFGVEEEAPVVHGEANVAHNVVMQLINRQEGKGHVVVMDNYFSSVGLFTEMATLKIYSNGTMRSNRVGLPSELKAVKNWSIHRKVHWNGQCMTHVALHVYCGRTSVWFSSFPHMLCPQSFHVCQYPPFSVEMGQQEILYQPRLYI